MQSVLYNIIILNLKKQQNSNMPKAFDKEQITSRQQNIQDRFSTPYITKELKEYFLQGKTPIILKEQQTSFKISIYFLTFLSPIMHILVVQQQIQSQSFTEIIQDYFNTIRSSLAVNFILLFFSISIKLLMVCSVIFQLIFKIKFVGISWIFTTFLQSNKFVSQLDLALSAFMTLINWTLYFSLLIVAILLNFFQLIYLQDYVIRKNLFYTSNAYQYICFRFLFNLIYLSNNLFLYYKDEEKFYFFYTCFGIVYCYWYFKKGCKLFPQRLTKNLFVFFNMILMAIFVTLGQKMIVSSSSFIASNQILKFCLIILVFFIIMHIRSQNLINEIVKGNTKNLKQVDIQLKQQLEMTQNVAQTHSQLIGILQMQQQFDKLLYDPFLKQYVSEQNIYTQKKTAISYFIKQSYEKIIQKYDDPAIQIDYCEFLCNQLNHFYLALKIIEQISYRPLNIIQKLKLSRLKLFIHDQNTKTNQQLFNNKLKIQFVVESQTIFEKISSLILKYIDLSYNAWKSIRQGILISSQIKNQFKTPFLLIEQIENYWNRVSHMLIYNPRWQLTYMHYFLFIKNQSINNRSSILYKEPFLNKPSTIDQKQEIYINEHQSDSKLLDQAIIFNFCSSFLIAKEQRGKLIIQRVNKRFIDATGYNLQQIAGNQIQILMPAQLAQTHQQKFDVWLNEGKMSNQNAYPIHHTSYITKYNQQIPAIKYYKAYYQLEKGIQFVCLLKKNVKNQRLFKDNDSQLLNVDEQVFNNAPLFQQHKRRFSKIECNIFLKSEQLKPRQTIEQISKFKLYLRMFLFITIASMIVISWITHIDNQDISKHCNQFITIMFLYRSPIVLSTNYMKKVTKLGNMANVNAQIQSNTKMMLSLSASSVAKSVIFDQYLNPSNIYYPSSSIPQFESVDLGNIDLFYTIVSAVSSLNQSVVNHTSRQFQILHSYAKPAYDNMMNITKYRLHQTIEYNINQSITKQIAFLLLHITIFMVFLIKILAIACRYFKKINSIEMVVTDFDQKNSSKIEKYWKTIDQCFKELFNSFNDQKQFSKINTLNEQKQELFFRNNTRTISFYQRQNGKQKDKSRKRFQIKIFLIIIFSMLAFINLQIFPELKMLLQFYQLRQFEAAGFFFLRYFPCGPLLVRGCMEKYYYSYFQSSTKFDSQKYDDALLAVYRFGNSDYIANIVDPSSLFYSKQKEYFFGKPCQYNSALLSSINISVQRCNSICSHAFQSGVLGYFRYLFKIGREYLKNDINLTSSKIDELTICTTIVTTYFFDAISSWTTQITIKMKSIQQNNIIITIIVILVITVLHIIVNQFKVVSLLSYQYDFIKYLYNNLVPEFTIIEEKILRQKLVMQGLIKN